MTDNPDYLSVEDEMARAWSLGFYAVEVEAHPDGASAFVWRQYQRDEGRSARGATTAEAIRKAVDRVVEREQVVRLSASHTCRSTNPGPTDAERERLLVSPRRTPYTPKAERVIHPDDKPRSQGDG